MESKNLSLELGFVLESGERFFALAGVAELAYASVSKTDPRKGLWVQLPPPARKPHRGKRCFPLHGATLSPLSSEEKILLGRKRGNECPPFPWEPYPPKVEGGGERLV